MTDALERRYLDKLFFSISEDAEGSRLLEEYIFSFSYSTTGEIGMTMGSASQGGPLSQGSAGGPRGDETRSVDQDTLKFQVLRMMRMLVEMCRTLDRVPDDRFLLIKLTYNDTAPDEYEPPMFARAEGETVGTFASRPFRLDVGKVDAGFHRVSLNLKSVLDPIPVRRDQSPIAQSFPLQSRTSTGLPLRIAINIASFPTLSLSVPLGTQQAYDDDDPAGASAYAGEVTGPLPQASDLPGHGGPTFVIAPGAAEPGGHPQASGGRGGRGEGQGQAEDGQLMEISSQARPEGFMHGTAHMIVMESPAAAAPVPSEERIRRIMLGEAPTAPAKCTSMVGPEPVPISYSCASLHL